MTDLNILFSDADTKLKLETMKTKNPSRVTISMLELALDSLADENTLTKKFAFDAQDIALWIQSNFDEVVKMPILREEVMEKLLESESGSRIRMMGPIVRGEPSPGIRECLYFTQPIASPEFHYCNPDLLFAPSRPKKESP